MRNNGIKCICCIVVLMLLVNPGHLQAQDGMTLRFVDSATGYAVQPDQVLSRNVVTGAVSEPLKTQQAGAAGYLSIPLKEGTYDVTVQSSGYRPLSTRLNVGGTPSTAVGEAQPSSIIVFHLDPLQPPSELQAASIQSLHRNDATVLLGFIVDAERGTPLEGVTIRSLEKNLKTISDNKGFFVLHVPVNAADDSKDSTTMMFEIPGYISEERRNVALWSGGDVIYKIALEPGEGKTVIDENVYQPGAHQLSEEGCAFEEAPAQEEGAVPSRQDDWKLGGQTVPDTIKVGRNCSGTSCSSVEVYTLQTYSKHSLASEWVPGWGAYSGGINSLKAGAVAIRSYAAWYVYHPLRSWYDICDTTSCQVFDPGHSSSYANTAVDETEAIVLFDSHDMSSRTIPLKTIILLCVAMAGAADGLINQAAFVPVLMIRLGKGIRDMVTDVVCRNEAQPAGQPVVS